MFKKCYEELIDGNKSTLVQTISLNWKDVMMDFNIITDDEGYLWAFGGMIPQGTFNLYKFRKPCLNVGDIVLSENDMLDSWIIYPQYVYLDAVWQGGKIYKNKLLFVTGSSLTGKSIVIFDTIKREIVQIIPLNDIIEEEPEDCELIGNKILLVVNGGNCYYIIEDINI